eukprot:gnl/TRDRNA2_/TRDRNA2_211224_c0_seq1.p1 gnl/TRDRNA2_/TRDRNA2_211224_c0~~gnl/TRDRNA2_/TRDRNA2_211224_c0_seq1.p1  ORF type:complete len:310 (+),score=36.74 gnl/TRDRNA2_/TRDRNA2_211224_c0_seq1:45-932(+)
MTRLVRFLRIPRLIKLISALRTLVYSVVVTLKSLVWAFVLLLVIVYVVSIVLTDSMLDRLGNADDPDLHEYWSTIPTAMFTLFKCISGGVNWHPVVGPLGRTSEVLVWLFSAYIFFTYFAVLNVVTGIFCHSAIETAQRDPDLVVQSVIDSKSRYVAKLRELFATLDADGSGDITIGELEVLLNDESVQAYFTAMGIETTDAWTLFKLIDVDRGNAIDVEEFIRGCWRLRDTAKSIDLVTLMAEQKQMMRMLRKFMHYVEEQFDDLLFGVDAAQPDPDPGKSLATAHSGLEAVMA